MYGKSCRCRHEHEHEHGHEHGLKDPPPLVLPMLLLRSSRVRLVSFVYTTRWNDVAVVRQMAATLFAIALSTILSFAWRNRSALGPNVARICTLRGFSPGFPESHYVQGARKARLPRQPKLPCKHQLRLPPPPFSGP